MGKTWDQFSRAQFVDFLGGIMGECYRVLKPGAHGLVWAIPRTAHWTGWAIEEAGFEVRDVVLHLFGTGFPKSADVSKAIDKAAGEQRERIRGVRSKVVQGTYAQDEWTRANKDSVLAPEPITDAAKFWHGWGTALKPAAEHWILCRKPLAGTVAANVLEHGTGAINVDGCRIAGGERPHIERRNDKALDGDVYGSGINGSRSLGTTTAGRFPANVTLDEEAAAMLDEQSGESQSVGGYRGSGARVNGYGMKADQDKLPIGFGDTGGASRFFYVSKADRADRGKSNNHPTVKSTALMRWLCTLITPPDGIILDPFMGTGPTIAAAKYLGFRAIGIEQDEKWCSLAVQRLSQEVLPFTD